MNRDDTTAGVLATLIAISGGVHLRLYLDGYRDISIDRIAGIDISRSFVGSFVAAALIAGLVVGTVAAARVRRPVYIAAALYSVGALVAYLTTRTVGLLGFEDTAWSWEAVVAKLSELSALGVVIWSLVDTSARRDSSAVSPA